MPRSEKIAWFDRLCAAQNRISEEKHQAYVGSRVRVLVDGWEDGVLTARTGGGRLVRLAGGSQDLIGQFAQAEITGASTWSLTGTL